MKNLYLCLLTLIIYVTPFSSVDAKQDKQLTIAGWLEVVILSPWQTRLRAKLDTGAKTSSMHAENIEVFERAGKQWVRFDLPKGKAKSNKAERVELPVVRDVMIKRHDLPPAIRYVVEAGFCLNQHYYTTEFTLADRKNFNYPILLGRQFLKQTILVDSSDSFLHKTKKKASCQPLTSPSTAQTDSELLSITVDPHQVSRENH